MKTSCASPNFWYTLNFVWHRLMVTITTFQIMITLSSKDRFFVYFVDSVPLKHCFSFPPPSDPWFTLYTGTAEPVAICFLWLSKLTQDFQFVRGYICKHALVFDATPLWWVHAQVTWYSPIQFQTSLSKQPANENGDDRRSRSPNIRGRPLDGTYSTYQDTSKFTYKHKSCK